MLVLYNFLQLVFLLLFLPFLIIFILSSPKYRDRIPARLGFGLARYLLGSAQITSDRTRLTIWLHALSVGEVTSAVPLVLGLRASYPDGRIIVSVATKTAKKLADRLLVGPADHVIYGPLDILPVVASFIKNIRPDLFILVETDFWPNLLYCLKRNKIPAILVNGRVSAKSLASYRRLRPFFVPMLENFSFLSMQTEQDLQNMHNLGMSREKLCTLGNLKFDQPAAPAGVKTNDLQARLPVGKIILVCGSTHPGEEEPLLDCYRLLKKEHSQLFLAIAPRNPDRAADIQLMAAARDLTATLRSTGTPIAGDLFILDTIGELVDLYGLADIGFVGGSMVAQGGHNPIEPASVGIPVLFGPHMEDFSEIAAELVRAGGASEISNQGDLMHQLSELLASEERRARQGQAARHCIERQRGVIVRHLELISRFL